MKRVKFLLMTAAIAAFMMGVSTFTACDKDDDDKDSKDYVDLGLPSGTKWKSENEEGLLTYEAAKSQFGNNLPSKEQMEELINECQWTWDGTKKGYTVTGQNGKSIFLPAAGWIDCGETEIQDMGKFGFYWTSTVNNQQEVCGLCLAEGEDAYVDFDENCYTESVRLVTK